MYQDWRCNNKIQSIDPLPDLEIMQPQIGNTRRNPLCGQKLKQNGDEGTSQIFIFSFQRNNLYKLEVHRSKIEK